MAENLPAVIQSYAVVQADPGMLSEIIKENVGDAGITPFDLDRIKMPSGGTAAFTVPSLQGDKIEQSIEGVIIYWDEVRAYWSEDFESSGGGTPPDCSSRDCRTGVGEPGGDCQKCPFAQFGSAKNSKGEDAAGQACKQMRRVYVLREKGFLPIALSVPPTSLASVRQYFLRLGGEGIPYYGVITRFKLEQAQNKAGVKYSKIRCEMVEQLDQETATRLKQYADSMKGSLSQVEITSDDYTAGNVRE